MDWKLEVVVVPVSDVERAKEFYARQLGFVVDVDTQAAPGMRVVQLTPPGSACSISFVPNHAGMKPGSLKGLQLVVSDIQVARAGLVERGVQASPVRHVDQASGDWADGPGGPWNSFIFFDDPDGNSWTVQEKPLAASAS